MTVREWFRVLRKAEWQRDLTSGVDHGIAIYFRNETPVGPLTPPARIYGLVTLIKLIDDGAPVHAFDRVRASMQDTILV